MARFYFDTHIRGKVHRDYDGSEYPDAETAIHAAKVGAAEYVSDRIAHGRAADHEEKLVRTENGEIVARFMITDTLDVMLPPKA